MDKKRIEKLIEKFYDGNTTIGEERLLENFFSQRDIPASMKAERDIFTFYTSSRNEDLPDDRLKQKIIQAIKSEGGDLSGNRRRMILMVSSIAASILILIGSFFLFIFPSGPGLAFSRYKDTFDNPELAYIETQKTLLYVSEILNDGTRELNKLSKFEKGTKELKNLKLVDKGTSQMETISLFSTGVGGLQRLSIFSKTKDRISNN
jgi:hypothetical protein